MGLEGLLKLKVRELVLLIPGDKKMIASTGDKKMVFA
jgi:hypothetical protein